MNPKNSQVSDGNQFSPGGMTTEMLTFIIHNLCYSRINIDAQRLLKTDSTNIASETEYSTMFSVSNRNLATNLSSDLALVVRWECEGLACTMHYVQKQSTFNHDRAEAELSHIEMTGCRLKKVI